LGDIIFGAPTCYYTTSLLHILESSPGLRGHPYRTSFSFFFLPPPFSETQEINFSEEEKKYNFFNFSGEKPYKCNICGRAFCQISNLKSHQKTHTKVKAFECDTCHKTFRRSFTLKQHKLIHERESKNAETKNIEIKSEIKKELDVFTGNQELPFVPVDQPVIEEHIEVDVCALESGMSPQHSSSTGDSLDISMDSDQDQLAAENRKDQASPHSNSDSGHGSPNAKLEHSSEEEATNSGSDDSGAVIQEKPRFYRPFEDTEKPAAGQWGAGQKRRADDVPIDITQTKRVRDTNGKIVVYPGIRETGNRINPTRLILFANLIKEVIFIELVKNQIFSQK